MWEKQSKYIKFVSQQMLRLLIFKMSIHAIPVCTFVKNVSLNANVCQQTGADKYMNVLDQNNTQEK